MTYEKPEIAVLGEASSVVLGTKNSPFPEPPSATLIPGSFELED